MAKHTPKNKRWLGKTLPQIDPNTWTTGGPMYLGALKLRKIHIGLCISNLRSDPKKWYAYAWVGPLKLASGKSKSERNARLNIEAQLDVIHDAVHQLLWQDSP